MTREELIEYIKANDQNYNYEKVNFNYYSDEELHMIYNRIQRQKKDEEQGKKK